MKIMKVELKILNKPYKMLNYILTINTETKNHVSNPQNNIHITKVLALISVLNNRTPFILSLCHTLLFIPLI